MDAERPVQPADSLHKVDSDHSTATMSEWVEYLLKLLAKVDDAEQAQEDDEVLIPEDYKGLTQKALQQLIDLDEDLDVLVKGLQPVQTKSEEHLEGIHTQCNYLGDSFRETMRMYRSGPVPWGQVFEALRGVGEERLCSELKVKYGDAHFLNEWLSHHAMDTHLERRGKLKLRILYHTVQCGPDKVIDILLEDLLLRKDSNTVLHYAVQCDHQKGRMGEKLSRKLIEKGADINAKNEEGATPLHLAARLNKEKVIDTLLDECDYDVFTLNAVDNQGRTPLLTAAAYGKKDAIDCLWGDDEIMTQVDDEGRSALFLTVEAGHSVAVKKVLDKTHLKATEPGNLLCKPNKDGDIPLHIAASRGNIKLVKMLLEYDPYHELENQTKERYNARNIKRTEKQIHQEVEVLWKSSQYYKLERQIKQRNKGKRTPLHVAAQNGQTAVVRMLLEDYPKIIPFCEEHTLDTPLHLACAKGHNKVVHTLLDAGANLKARNADGETPFHLAAGRGHKELVEELIGVNKSCIELEDNKGRTPLRYASDEHHADVVSVLLNSGAQIQSRDNCGVTVIDAAIDAGHEDVVGAIIDSDAWVEALRPHRDEDNKNKLTPFRMMIQKMPGVATKVLNRCTLKDPKNPDVVMEGHTVVFDYQFLEDFGKPDDQGSILTLLISWSIRWWAVFSTTSGGSLGCGSTFSTCSYTCHFSSL